MNQSKNSSDRISAGQAGKRGGSWNNNPVNCRSAYRNNNNPRETNNNIGFRIVCSSPSTLQYQNRQVGYLSGVSRRVQTCSCDAPNLLDERHPKIKPGQSAW